jgi:hypothetical protein
MIYGAIGYSILGESEIFKDIEIILLADQHDEPTSICTSDDGKIVPSVLISEYLKKLLHKNYVVLIEEIPYDGELVGLWEDSVHVKNIRKFYLLYKHHKLYKNNIVAFDIRLDIIQNFDKNYSDEKILQDYINKIYEFCIFKLNILQHIPLYSNKIDKSILRDCYFKILNNFTYFIKIHKDYLHLKIKDIPNNKEIYNTIDTLLSDIIEFFCVLSIYNMIINNNKKFVVYCGLYHIENIQQILLKYFKFNLLKTYGTMSMKKIINHAHNNMCVNLSY